LISKITSTHKDSFRLIRDILWLSSRYDKKALKEFVDNFNPDIIFIIWRASVKMCKAVSLLKECTDVPIAACTGDNELDEGVPMFSPFAIIRRFMIRRTLGKLAPKFAKYYTSSEEQAKTYAKNYGIKTDLLFKCAEAEEEKVHKELNNPIRFLYVGRLYCGRWKTLAKIGNVLKKINKEEIKAVLDIYSMDKVSKKQIKRLDDGRSTFFRGAISPYKIKDEYKKSDIVLHVESLDKKNRAVTRHSYSTKVVDCLASGCAVMAIGWERHSACVELKKADSAFIASNAKEIDLLINNICENPDLILEYSQKSMNDAKTNHSRVATQQKLYNDFINIIKGDI
ncbi:MAG: glycosyltransferase, partial [Clostridia bacterium]|nr:glycosyltransferase [Clostridia bacterium]